MRLMLKVNIPVEEGNHAAKKSRLGETIQDILAEQKPEAVYFGDDNGERTAFIFVHIKENSEIPKLVEPWFLAFNASVEIHPVMAPEDLVKAVPDIEKAVKKYAQG
jgi:hypothetical protein